jgi:hypothetical protein
MDPIDFQDSPSKIEMMKTEMTNKTLRTGLTKFMDSYIRLTSLTFTPHQPLIPFPFLSPVFQHLPKQQMEDTTALDTTDSNIDDYTLAPRSVQAKVDNSCLLKVFQWLQDLR